MMPSTLLLASTSAILTTLFAAVAAVAALTSIWQARLLHKEDAEARELDRHERREQFDRESDERRRAYENELRARQLEQLGQISERVALVRETARREADAEGRLQGGLGTDQAPADRYIFFWNARKQLEFSLASFQALGGRDELTACHDLATGSTMNFVQPVVAAATSAFDELARAAASRQLS